MKLLNLQMVRKFLIFRVKYGSDEPTVNLSHARNFTDIQKISFLTKLAGVFYLKTLTNEHACLE